VEAISLDDFFGNLGWPRVDVIKLDIEGAEARALSGMSGILWRNSGVRIIMELNTEALDQSGSSLPDLVTTLRRLGFLKAFLIERRREVELESLLHGSAAVHNLLLTRVHS
jgi:hypothetical protein